MGQGTASAFADSPLYFWVFYCSDALYSLFKLYQYRSAKWLTGCIQHEKLCAIFYRSILFILSLANRQNQPIHSLGFSYTCISCRPYNGKEFSKGKRLYSFIGYITVINQYCCSQFWLVSVAFAEWNHQSSLAFCWNHKNAVEAAVF